MAECRSLLNFRSGYTLPIGSNPILSARTQDDTVTQSTLEHQLCEVSYRGQVIGITQHNRRYDLIHAAIQDGRIALPFRSYELAFRWIDAEPNTRQR